MPANNPSPDVQVVNENLKKYQTITNELAQINQEKLRQESVKKLTEELSSRPISDFQRSQAINHIKQHLNNPDFKLSRDEQQKLHELESTVDMALKTSTNTNELTYNIHEQIKNNRHFDVPDKNQFQQELNAKLSDVKELPKYQQARQYIKKELAHLDPKDTIKSLLLDRGEVEAETISTQITSKAFNSLVTSSTPPTKQQLQAIIDIHQPPLSSTVKTDVLSVLTADQELVQSIKTFDSTKQELANAGINQQSLSQFLQVNQLTSQDFRTVMISSDQPTSSSQNYNLPTISNYLQTYRSLTSGQTTVSFWRSPSQAVRSWFSNAGSSGQIGTKNFFQRVISSFNPGEGGVGGFRGGNIRIPSIGGNNGAGSLLGNFAKRGMSQVGNTLGSAAKTGAKAAGKAALQAAKAAAQAAGKALSQFAAKALILNPYFWIGVVVVIIIVAIIYLAGGASPQKIALMQTDSISGASGSLITCEGDDCQWPVQCGCITQGPFAGTHSLSKLNAIDIMTYMCPGEVAVQSVTSGTVSYVFDSLSFGEPGGPGNYGNHVIIDVEADGTSFQLLYAHMINIQVSVGNQVGIGTIIGTADTTGMGDAHLHFEIRGGRIQDILPPEGKSIPDNCLGLDMCGGICIQN